MCEPRHLLATLADAGIGQRSIDLINNQNSFAGEFTGREGKGTSNPIEVLTDVVLNDIAFQHTVDAIAATQSVPAGATLITTKSQLLNNITSGSVANPNIYHVMGDFSLTNSETIDIPSNVEVYFEGSIFKEGTFVGPSGENSSSYVIHVDNSDNVKLVGIDNARVHSNPSLDPSDPHTTAFRIEGSATNVLVEGFEIDHHWQAVDVRIGTNNVTVKNNYVHDIVNRAIWFLGTTDSVVVHNFIVNPGLDGIDFDAYTADSTAYENVIIGAGRFAFFVEEGANNNFSVRQLSILYRFAGQNPSPTDFSNSSRPTGFMLGNTSNGTSEGFFINNSSNDPQLYTRDNFFIDNLTIKPIGQNFRVAGDYLAVADNGTDAINTEISGNTYFFANRGYGAGVPSATSTRDVSYKALYEDKLPNREIIAATNGGFDQGNVSSFGFNSYDLVDVLNDLDSTYNTTPTPIRAEILPDPFEPIVFKESGGLLVVEAENFNRREPGTGIADGKFFNLLIDNSRGGQESIDRAASGDQGIVSELNPDLQPIPSVPAFGSGINTGNSLVGPRADYKLVFETPGTYRVFVRTRASAPGDNSFHLGLDGVPFTTGAGSGVGLDSPLWSWTDDVNGGQQDLTVNIPSAGRYTFNIWMRDDGAEIDKFVLEIDGSLPTDFGPDESERVSPTTPPVVTQFLRDGQPADQPELLSRPDLLTTLSFKFDQDVNIDISQILFRNDTNSGFYQPFAGGFSYDESTFTATWDASLAVPPVAPLEPGFYTFALNSANVSAVSSLALLDGNGDGQEGDFFTQQVYVAIPGDANLDGTVDILSDGFALVGNLGSSSDTSWATGDFNADGNVNVLGDGFALISNLGMDVRPPSPAIVSSSLNAGGLAFAVFPSIDENYDVQDQEVVDSLPVIDSTVAPVLAGCTKIDNVFEDEFLI